MFPVRCRCYDAGTEIPIPPFEGSQRDLQNATDFHILCFLCHLSIACERLFLLSLCVPLLLIQSHVAVLFVFVIYVC